MKKKLFLFFLLFGLMVDDSNACDVCGSSITGGSIGLLTAYKSNYIGIGWQLARFNTGQEKETKDVFHVMEVSARIKLTERFNLLFHQPFKRNTRETSSDIVSVTGISDTRLLLNYSILNDVSLGSDLKLYAELGLGVKLPLGKYNPSIHQKNVPENFNLGNGSWGYLMQPAIVINKNLSGIVLSGYFQYNAKSSSDYQFGRQMNGQFTVYHQYALSEGLNLVPNIGMGLESISTDKYANETSVHGTGGDGGFAKVACQIKHEKWIIGAAYQHPVWSDYSGGDVTAKGRISCQLNFIF